MKVVPAVDEVGPGPCPEPKGKLDHCVAVARLAKLVLDDGDALAVVAAQDVVDQGGLARALHPEAAAAAAAGGKV